MAFRNRGKWLDVPRYLALGLLIASGLARSSPANAGCTSTPIAGGQQVDCAASTAPDPTPGAVAIPGGDNVVRIFSGTYNGGFSVPSGNNTITVTGGVINVGVTTGAGNDQFTMGAGSVNGAINQGGGADRFVMSGGTITGNIDQAGGVDTFIMTGGTIIGNVEQSADFDTFFMSGGTITGAFIEGDNITITGGSIGSVNMNIGNNVFTMSGGTVVGDVIGFGNNDTFNLSGGSIGGNVDLGNGQNVFNVTGGQIAGSVTSGTGVDRFTWTGGGTIGGAINLGAGDDIATLRNLTDANLTMPLLDGGAGADTLTFDNTVATGVARFQNWESIALTNATRLTMDGNLVLGDAATLTGALSVDASSTLFAGGGNFVIVANDGVSPVAVTNAGAIDLTNGGGSTADTFTVFGNYIGAGGTLRLQTVLGSDGSASDRLVVSGAGNSATGSTGVAIINAGGAGAATVADGILVVEAVNGASTAGGSFFLRGPAAAGAREYQLFQGGLTGGNPSNWYLRSTAVVSGPLQIPQPLAPLVQPPGITLIQLIRPEVAVHTAVAPVARTLELLALGTFHQRQGDQSLLGGDQPNAAWARIFGQHTHEQFAGGVLPSFDGVLGGIQTGVDLARFDWAGGHRTRAGLYIGQSEAAVDVRGSAVGLLEIAAGDIKLGATSVGAYWTHIGPGNWYIDAVLQGSFISGRGSSERGVDGHVRGLGLAASLEGGYPIPLTPWLRFEPQAQAIWQHTALDNANDGLSTIAYRDADVLVGRIGARLQATMPGAGTIWHPYAKANLWWASDGNDAVSFGTDTIFTERNGGVTGELGLGVSGQITPSLSVYGDAAYRAGLEGEARETIQGNIGIRVTW
jgi:outer membrane autotransporter protein